MGVTNLFAQVEQLFERVVEGGTRSLFRSRVQPIELAKAAARAMQRQQIVGPDGVEVSNAFTIRLHPDDLAPLDGFRVTLEARIARYLATFAEDRGLYPVGPIEVSLVGDSAVYRRGIRVDAEMTDGSGPATGLGEIPLAATAPLPRATVSAPRPAAISPGLLRLEDGRGILLDRESVSIGRALDNDIVIADSRVSRYHLSIARDRHGFVVRDLGSTNGTQLGDRAISEDRLEAGDRLSLGGYIIEAFPPVQPGSGRTSAG